MGFLQTVPQDLYPKMYVSISVTSALIYLHLSVYLYNPLYHQMLISTGILENTLSQSYQCEKPLFLILLLRGCCTPVSCSITQLGVLRAL